MKTLRHLAALAALITAALSAAAVEIVTLRGLNGREITAELKDVRPGGVAILRDGDRSETYVPWSQIDREHLAVTHPEIEERRKAAAERAKLGVFAEPERPAKVVEPVTAWTHLHALVFPDGTILYGETLRLAQDELQRVRVGSMLKLYAATDDKTHKAGLEWMRADAPTRERLLASLRALAADMPRETAPDRSRAGELERLVAGLEKDATSTVSTQETRVAARRWLASLPQEPTATKPTREQVEEARKYSR